MKIVAYASDKPREHMLMNALKEGVLIHGDEFEMRRTAEYGETPDGEYRKYQGPTPDTDVAVFFGVKGKSRVIFDEHRAMGKATIYLDKGITRNKGAGGHTEYTRAFVNDAHPLAYMMARKMPKDRFKALGVKLSPRTGGQNILICGSSQKYHDFHGPTRS